MTTTTLFAARKPVSFFLTEWLALAALALLDVIFMRAIGFHLLAGWRNGAMIFTALLVTLALRLAGRRRGGMIAEYFALCLLALPLFGLFTNLCMAASGPWADPWLLAVDRALGFDWLSGFNFLVARPLLWQALKFLYFSIFCLAVYFAVLFGLLDRRDRLRETFQILFVSLLLTGVGAMLWPALGPFKDFGLDSYGLFLPDMERLHARRDLTFALGDLSGVVGFPSFHTTFIMAYAYAFRRTGLLGHGVLVINAVILLSVPFVGGHYLTDMIGGAVVLLMSIVIVKLVQKVPRPATFTAMQMPPAASEA
jgi:hypothetical protein